MLALEDLLVILVVRMFIRMMLQEILVISKALATLLAKIGFFATLKAGEKLTMNSILHFSCRHCFDHGAVRAA